MQNQNNCVKNVCAWAISRIALLARAGNILVFCISRKPIATFCLQAFWPTTAWVIPITMVLEPRIVFRTAGTV